MTGIAVVTIALGLLFILGVYIIFEVCKLGKRIDEVEDNVLAIKCNNSDCKDCFEYTPSSENITSEDLENYSPSSHQNDLGSIVYSGFVDGINGTRTEIDYSKLNAGSKEKFENNHFIFAADAARILKQTHKPPLFCKISRLWIINSPSALAIKCTLGRTKSRKKCYGCECNITEMVQRGFKEGLGEARKHSKKGA